MFNQAAVADDPDWAVRAKAFDALEQLVIKTGGRIPWKCISEGFDYKGQKVHFAGRATGIFKPKLMSAALSVKTSKPRPGRASWYRDQDTDIDDTTGLLSYDLQQNATHSSNEHLLRAYKRKAPLIYFRAAEPAVYEAIWPVWIEDFDREVGHVLLAAPDTEHTDVNPVPAELPGGGLVRERERSYAWTNRKWRNHQAWFSSRTKAAYGYRCAFSGLPLGELLVGAHIKADEAGGPASVTNGICMSTLHHAAFDGYLIGVDPDLRIHVADRVIAARDGPLLGSLQALKGVRLQTPVEAGAHPDREFLEWRFSRFQSANTWGTSD